MTEFTDKTYNVIAKQVYKLDPKENDKPLEIGATFKSDGQVFKIIDATGNSAEPTTNGMQLIEVI